MLDAAVVGAITSPCGGAETPKPWQRRAGDRGFPSACHGDEAPIRLDDSGIGREVIGQDLPA
jgi:hypothetical protein